MKFKINDLEININSKPYLIAEVSANHNGSIDRALELIETAKLNGADAVKFQTYTANTMTFDLDTEDFKIDNGGLWDGQSLYSLYKKAETPFEWMKKLFDRGKEVGITVFSTPFDDTAIELLEELNTPMYKVASFELTDHELLKNIAKTKKPVILSTGLGNFEEIEESVNVLKNNGSDNIAVLHCISGYPTPTEDLNLATIKDLRDKLNLITGFSDHTKGINASVAATAYGAKIIEKHLIDTHETDSADKEFSINPSQLQNLSSTISEFWESHGEPNYEIKSSEKQNLRFRRSLYFNKDLKVGKKISKDDISRVRPGHGLEIKYLDEIIGLELNQDISLGDRVSFDKFK
tara:strand:- start:5154 stop:6200 length:1047 start_codon:yes stop_codon:yes gene_type:complete